MWVDYDLSWFVDFSFTIISLSTTIFVVLLIVCFNFICQKVLVSLFDGLQSGRYCGVPIAYGMIYTPKESSNAYVLVLTFSEKLEFRIKKYFGIH